MIRSSLILLATLSLTSAALRGTANFPQDMNMNPDYQFFKEQGITPELKFELSVTQGIDPKDALINLQSFEGEASLDELDAQWDEDSDRELQLVNLCGTIENLFSGMVLCTCSNPLLTLGTINFVCDYAQEIAKDGASFTPHYEGTFAYRIFAMTYKYTSVICANSVYVYVPKYARDISLGNFCFTLQYQVSYSKGQGIQQGITACQADLGYYGNCYACVPCTTSSGNPGIALSCTVFSTVVCIPISLPFSSGSKVVDGSNFFQSLDIQPIIDQAVADTDAQQAAQDSQNAATGGNVDSVGSSAVDSDTTTSGGNSAVDTTGTNDHPKVNQGKHNNGNNAGGDTSGTGTSDGNSDSNIPTGVDGTVTGNDGTVTGNDGTVTGNDGTVTGSDGTVTGSDGAVTGSDGEGTASAGDTASTGGDTTTGGEGTTTNDGSDVSVVDEPATSSPPKGMTWWQKVKNWIS